MTMLPEPERKRRAQAWAAGFENARNADFDGSRSAVPLQFALRGAHAAYQHGWDAGQADIVSAWHNPFMIRGETPDSVKEASA